MVRFSCLSVTVVVILVCTSLAFSQHYSIQDLGILNDSRCSGAAAMSSQRVVGTSGSPFCSDTHIRAFLWTPDTGMQDLGTFPGGDNSSAFGVNSHGIVIGDSAGVVNGNFYSHAFAWTRAGGMRDIGVLPGGTYSLAIGINGSGLIVGYGDDANDGNRHAILWSGSSMTDLGAISGQADSLAVAINREGDVVGYAGGTAALWRADGTYVNLGTLPGDYASSASAISGGRIVGWSATAGKPRAFLWTKNKGMRNLGLLPNGTFSVATGVIGQQVVGYGDNSGFIWTPANGMKDLNDLIVNGQGWHVTFANDINCAGQITGQGYLFGWAHAFLLTPAP